MTLSSASLRASLRSLSIGMPALLCLGLAGCGAELVMPGGPDGPAGPDGGGGDGGDPPGVLTIGFAVAESSAWEGTGSWPIELTASEALPAEVTLTVTVAGGTASSGDYTLASATVVMAAGATSARLAIPIADDLELEAPETLQLSITAAGAETGARAAHTLTLLDNDARAWPGDAAVTLADSQDRLGGNLSGLTYEAAAGAVPARLWAVKNGPSVLYRLERSGGLWEPSTTDGWASGKTLRYPGGNGSPDAEGVTRANPTTAAIYVATERDNDNGNASRPGVLRYDTSGAATTLSATNEWNLTADLPAVGANAGFEAITWLPDAMLVKLGFRDEKLDKPYAPADYPNHGDGLFALGLEGNGMIYVYALDHGAGGGFTRLAAFASGHVSVMSLEQDGKLLWAGCDNTCNGETTLLTIDDNPTSTSHGKFVLRRRLDRPAGLPNLNDEGIALSPDSECVNKRKPFFWTDDGADDDHALRQGTVACGPF